MERADGDRVARPLWFMHATIEPRAGGVASFDPGEGPATSTVTVWDPPRRARVPLAVPRRRRRARIWTLEPLDDGAATRLVPVHTALPADWAAGYGSG
jgi:hypothetical protein